MLFLDPLETTYGYWMLGIYAVLFAILFFLLYQRRCYSVPKSILLAMIGALCVPCAYYAYTFYFEQFFVWFGTMLLSCFFTLIISGALAYSAVSD